MAGLTLCLLLNICFWGCNLNSHKAEIMMIDSLNNELERSEKSLLEIPSDKFEYMLETSKENMETVEKNTKDTLDLPSAIVISDYAYIKKTLTKFKDRKHALLRELEYSKTQLKEMHHDLEKNLLPSDSISIYIENEKNANTELIAKIKSVTDNVLLQMQNFDSINPKMQEIIEKIKSGKSRKI